MSSISFETVSSPLPVSINFNYAKFVPNVMLLMFIDGSRVLMVHDMVTTPEIAKWVNDTQDCDMLHNGNVVSLGDDLEFAAQEYFDGLHLHELCSSTLVSGHEVLNDSLFLYSDSQHSLTYAKKLFHRDGSIH